MMKPSEMRAIADEDLTKYSRDVLEFNHRQLAKAAVDWIDMIDQQHADRLAKIRTQIDVGALVLAELERLRRAGRKTANLTDVIRTAQLKLHGFGEDA